ncbi:ComEC/Rec2 family competence protein [Thermotoga caldifontis]|uniref:ComEC/Rec2 family competence protein n=1 Tax=Thermotoga caldifontis TaxID=1508419 RepID=UPI000596E8CF|nr:ComEC/Rec2 family competence protein [Thermotoga caldifontis]
MKFFWLTAFVGLSTGVILSPVFPLTLLASLLLFFKKRYLIAFVVFFCLGNFLASVQRISGSCEIVGYATVERSNHVIATNVKVFSNGGWERILHSVKIYSEDIQAGEKFYAFGNLSFQFAYPALTMKADFASSTRYGNEGFEKLHSKLIDFKRRIVDFFRKNVPDYAEQLSTLVFSDPSFDASQAERVRKSGLAHLFAVSGLHVGIVYTLFDLLVSLFTHNLFVRRPLSTLLTFTFALMTGPSPSALRAATMLAVWNLFRSIDYPIEPLNLLGLVATMNLLFEPFVVLSPSFLMSYSAAATLVAIQERLRNLHGAIKNLLISLFAFAGVAPFLLLFSTLNLFAPLLSVPAILIATLILWTCVLVMFLLTMNLQSAATILIRGATPLFWSLQGLIDLSSKFLNLSGNFVVYLISSALLLFLLWHFGQSPKNFTS